MLNDVTTYVTRFVMFCNLGSSLVYDPAARKTLNIVMFAVAVGAFAVVDVDTLRRRKETKGGFHWKGRACAEEFAGDITPVSKN